MANKKLTTKKHKDNPLFKFYEDFRNEYDDGTIYFVPAGMSPENIKQLCDCNEYDDETVCPKKIFIDYKEKILDKDKFTAMCIKMVTDHIEDNDLESLQADIANDFEISQADLHHMIANNILIQLYEQIRFIYSHYYKDTEYKAIDDYAITLYELYAKNHPNRKAVIEAQAELLKLDLDQQKTKTEDEDYSTARLEIITDVIKLIKSELNEMYNAKSKEGEKTCQAYLDAFFGLADENGLYDYNKASTNYIGLYDYLYSINSIRILSSLYSKSMKYITLNSKILRKLEIYINI